MKINPVNTVKAKLPLQSQLEHLNLINIAEYNTAEYNVRTAIASSDLGRRKQTDVLTVLYQKTHYAVI